MDLRDSRRQPNTSPREGLVSGERVKPVGPIQAPSGSPASGTSTPDVSPTRLMEAILDEQNLRLALRRVVANHDAPGVDRVSTEDFVDYLGVPVSLERNWQ